MFPCFQASVHPDSASDLLFLTVLHQVADTTETAGSKQEKHGGRGPRQRRALALVTQGKQQDAGPSCGRANVTS